MNTKAGRREGWAAGEATDRARRPAGEVGVGVAVVAIAIVSALAARLVGQHVLHDVPHVMDEIAYVFEAKLMASGHVTAPVALPRAAFNMWFVDDRGARFGIFPPGWPAVLALGMLLGLSSWTNPLLHLATVILVGRAGGRLGGPRLELTTALLYAACPQSILLAASMMSHALVAFAASLVTLAIATVAAGGHAGTGEKGRRAESKLFALAGAALGLAAVTRPLCALVLALPVAAVLLERRRGWLVGVVLATLSPFVVALGAFHRALTGSAFVFPQSSYFDEHIAPANVPFFTYGRGCNALGFGKACDYTVRGGMHTLASALSDAGDNLRSWAVLASGPLLVVGLVLVLARRPERTTARWLVAMPALAILLYALYWQAGVCYGARFYHAALPALVLASALGVVSVLGSRRRVFAGVLAAALACDAGGMAIALREMRGWSFWGTDERFAELAASWKEGASVVMVAFGRDDVYNPKLVATAAMGEGGPWLLGIRALAALGQNDPVLDRGQVVFAKFHPALVEAIAARFPERKLWLYTAWADRSKDVLEPFSPTRFAGHVYRLPADNFDGFRVGAPYRRPDPLLREATDEGWPP